MPGQTFQSGVAVVLLLTLLVCYNLRLQRQSGGYQAVPVRISDLLSQSQQQLSSHMRYWESSQKISRPSGDVVFPEQQQEKFITWEPDFGGSNNVRLQMEMLAILAHATGRTFVLPGHINSGIDHLERSSTVEDFYDFEHLGRWLSVKTMQQYLDARGLGKDHIARSDTEALKSYLRDSQANSSTEHPDWRAVKDVLALPGVKDARVMARRDPSLTDFATTDGGKRPNRRINELSEKETAAQTLHFISNDNYRLFGGHGFLFFPTLAWQKFYWAGLRDHVHYNSDIIKNASILIAAVARAADGPFNTVHYRTTDWAKQFPQRATNPNILTERLLQIFGNQLPLFVATDDANRTVLQPLIDAFPKVMFLDEFTDALPGLQGNMYGMMDQLICSVGKRFAGSFGSTFTGYIHRLRGYHAPAFVTDKGVYYINYPRNDAAYRDTFRHNKYWADSVWWPQQDADTFRDQNYAREFSFTWDMERDWQPSK